jgi:hypothetical protein
LTESRTQLLRIKADDIDLPHQWIVEDPEVKNRLAQEFFESMTGGLIESLKQYVLKALEHLCYAMDAFEKNGTFVKNKKPDEKRDLQSELLNVLRARGAIVQEGTEIAGGETDIILEGNLVIENKVEGATGDPKKLKPNADWQARRYAIALNSRVTFVVVAYKPSTEKAFLSLPDRVSVYSLQGASELRSIVRVLVPWGYAHPSSAKAPSRC